MIRPGYRFLARHRAVFGAFLAGALCSYLYTQIWTADPNQDWDPQAGTNFFCDRDEVARAPGPGTWSAVAYYVNCDVLGTNEVIYVYLLRPGQITSRAMLIARYEGSAPKLSWPTSNVLRIQVDKFFDLSRLVSNIIDLNIEFIHGATSSSP